MNGDRGPWVVERIVGMPELGSDHSARNKARQTILALQRLPGGQDLLERVQFYCSDGAADAQLAGELSKHRLPNLSFILWDTTHANMLVIKRALEDEEVARGARPFGHWQVAAKPVKIFDYILAIP